ncbi:MAG: MATE family efflux transporter [Bacillota bacterium]|nr:MATE family efflux transporter [Bacillota bacterium]
MKELDKDFITQGKISSVIMTLSLPLMFNNLVRTLYNLTDGLFVARLSAEDFAATSFVWPLNSIFISLGIGIGIGATSLISQYLGAKNYKKAESYANNAIIMIFLLGILSSIIGYLTAPTFLYWMGARDSFLLKATAYLQISFFGLFFDFMFFGYQAILNAEGLTKDITRMSVISSLVNVILDPIFIFDKIPFTQLTGLNLGITGAAWATIASKFVLMLMAIATVNKRSNIKISYGKTKPDFSIMSTIGKIAFPTAIGYSGSSFGFTFMHGFIQSFGTNTMAAFAIGNRVTDLVTQPQMAIGTALTSIIGQNVGAGNIERVKEVFKKALLIVFSFSLVASIVVLLFQSQLLTLFIKEGSDPEIWLQASEYIVFSAFIIFFMGFYSGFTGFFQGIGKTKYSMFMSIGRLWFVRLPMIWTFNNFTNLGPRGIWISMLVSNFLTVFYAFIVYKKINLNSLSPRS